MGKLQLLSEQTVLWCISCNRDVTGAPICHVPKLFSEMPRKKNIPFHWAHSVPNTRHESAYHVLQDWVLCDYYPHTSFGWHRPLRNGTRGAGSSLQTAGQNRHAEKLAWQNVNDCRKRWGTWGGARQGDQTVPTWRAGLNVQRVFGSRFHLSDSYTATVWVKRSGTSHTLAGVLKKYGRGKKKTALMSFQQHNIRPGKNTSALPSTMCPVGVNLEEGDDETNVCGNLF